tara:strand:- start:2028 stop:2960 length:933 start_codon:yes stop_codon:yes gene_type:complete
VFALISSPSQYYNLLEFIAHGIVKAEDITMIYFKRNNEFKNKFNYLDFEKISRIYVINQRQDNKLISKIYWYYNVIFHLFLYLLSFKYKLISGQIWCSHHSIFAYFTPKKNIYSLDDGNANLVEFTSGKSPFASKIKNLINHFSLISLPFKRVIKNNLLYLKDKSTKIKFNSDEYIIIGSPLISDNYLSKSRYIDKINYLKKKLPMNSKIFYLPHRREKLEDLVETDLKIIESKGCFELWVLNQLTLPTNFISFGSGLSLVLDSLFGSNINQYISKFEKKDFFKNQKNFNDSNKDIYEYYFKTVSNLKEI